MQRAPTTCYFHDLLLMTTSSHPQHLLPTVLPTGAGRRFFSSFVRERVGLRSGGISLRSLAQAKPPRPFKRHPEILRAQDPYKAKPALRRFPRAYNFRRSFYSPLHTPSASTESPNLPPNGPHP